jgi:hypothetical protein
MIGWVARLTMDGKLTAIVMELRQRFESFSGERLVQMLLLSVKA